MGGLPIDLEFFHMYQAIPVRLAELSRKNPEEALKYLRLWAEDKIAISELFNKLGNAISDDAASI